jgi:Tol biopolymer transport system component
VKDYAATWRCDNEKIVFVSERYGSPDLFEMPISGDEEAVQMTYEGSDDIYPLGATSDENASREGRSASATYSRQTSFLLSEASITPRDPSPDSAQRDEWIDRDMCAAFVRR